MDQFNKLTYGITFAYELGCITSEFLDAEFFDAIPPSEPEKNNLDQSLLNCTVTSVQNNTTYMPSFIINQTLSEIPELEDASVTISAFY